MKLSRAKRQVAKVFSRSLVSNKSQDYPQQDIIEFSNDALYDLLPSHESNTGRPTKREETTKM